MKYEIFEYRRFASLEVGELASDENGFFFMKLKEESDCPYNAAYLDDGELAKFEDEDKIRKFGYILRIVD